MMDIYSKRNKKKTDVALTIMPITWQGPDMLKASKGGRCATRYTRPPKVARDAGTRHLNVVRDAGPRLPKSGPDVGPNPGRLSLLECFSLKAIETERHPNGREGHQQQS